MTRPHQLGELQLAIMQVLWTAGEATVAAVHEALAPERRRALTTIATMLSKMERKGVVEHRIEGRQFVYRPTVSEAEVQRGMVADLTTRLFGGDVSALVSHLLTEQEIDPDELSTIRDALEQHAGDDARDPHDPESSGRDEG